MTRLGHEKVPPALLCVCMDRWNASNYREDVSLFSKIYIVLDGILSFSSIQESMLNDIQYFLSAKSCSHYVRDSK